MKVTDPISVRNLERIQEDERGHSSSRWYAALLGGLAVGAITIAGVMTINPRKPATQSVADPLAELAQKVKQQTTPKPVENVDPSEATFATRLVDREAPTTALAAVKNAKGELLPQAAGPTHAEAPPALERLPVVPLPAGSLLESTRVTLAPSDGLTQVAANKSKAPASDGSVPPGADGGYQIQVASFRDPAEADTFVTELNRRGHRAYRQAAYVPERGLWHRVRLGPFKYKHEAAKYQAGFEHKERMSTFLVDPEKVERQRVLRAAKLAAQEQ